MVSKKYPTAVRWQGTLFFCTDHHDVDEDLRTILEQGGKWQVDVHAGTMIRQLSDGISYTGNVAF